MSRAKPETAQQRAKDRARQLVDLVWHVGAFLIISPFLVFIDAVADPSNVRWAWWVVFPWAVGVGFHALSYLVEGRQLEERKARQYFQEELEREQRIDELTRT